MLKIAFKGCLDFRDETDQSQGCQEKVVVLALEDH